MAYAFFYNVLSVLKIFNSTIHWILFIPSSCVLLYFILKIWQLPPNRLVQKYGSKTSNKSLRTKLPFMVPFVPILPIVAIMANIFLMCRLSMVTWIRFIVWCIIGKWRVDLNHYLSKSSLERFLSQTNTVLVIPLVSGSGN